VFWFEEVLKTLGALVWLFGGKLGAKGLVLVSEATIL
jgi:hypothetical protein